MWVTPISFYIENIFDILINESRLVYGRPWIAVAELFLFILIKRKRPESSRSWFGRECRDEEILLVFV